MTTNEDERAASQPRESRKTDWLVAIAALPVAGAFGAASYVHLGTTAWFAGAMGTVSYLAMLAVNKIVRRSRRVEELRHEVASLQSELDRADVVAPEEIPPNVVTMNSTVQFTIAETGKDFCLTLVYPRDMDGSADRVSIFAPVGSALLGLSVGDELAWPGPGGKSMTVKVKSIIYQPESAGELHR